MNCEMRLSIQHSPFSIHHSKKKTPGGFEPVGGFEEIDWQRATFPRSETQYHRRWGA